MAVDAVFDSVSVATTFKEKLGELGIIFCSFSEAVHEHPELVRKYLGSVVPYSDNFFATLNSRRVQRRLVRLRAQGRALPDGAVHLLPHQRRGHRAVRADANRGRRGRVVSYLEGCTAPMRDENQLHAAVVELVALDNATIKYSTVQNWYPGDKEGQRRDLQLRDQARQVRRRQFQDLLDAGRDRLGHHLEIPELHSAGRQLGGRVLLGGA